MFANMGREILGKDKGRKEGCLNQTEIRVESKRKIKSSLKAYGGGEKKILLSHFCLCASLFLGKLKKLGEDKLLWEESVSN